MNKTITDAIKQKKLLEFKYDGFPRIVEPHAYGMTNNGNHVLSAYQVKGGSVSGDSVGWKLFTILEIRQLVLTQNAFFRPRDGYQSGNRQMKKIYCQI